jgi:plasmid stabilization system protein ParE
MTLAIDFLPQAELEIEAASLWYEKQSPDLGIRFLLAIDAALRRASENPLSFPKVLRRTRKAVIRRYPYVVFYTTDLENLRVARSF